MAAGLYQAAINNTFNGSIDWDTNTLKVMLVTTAYTYNPDHAFISDVSASELSVTGYTGGFGGSGRKTVACAVSANNTNDETVLEFAGGSTVTWTSLAAGATIGGAILVKEVTNDAASPVLCFWDLVDTATNGGNITLSFTSAASRGNIRIAS